MPPEKPRPPEVPDPTRDILSTNVPALHAIAVALTNPACIVIVGFVPKSPLTLPYPVILMDAVVVTVVVKSPPPDILFVADVCV